MTFCIGQWDIQCLKINSSKAHHMLSAFLNHFLPEFLPLETNPYIFSDRLFQNDFYSISIHETKITTHDFRLASCVLSMVNICNHDLAIFFGRHQTKTAKKKLFQKSNMPPKNVHTYIHTSPQCYSKIYAMSLAMSFGHEGGLVAAIFVCFTLPNWQLNYSYVDCMTIN